MFFFSSNSSGRAYPGNPRLWLVGERRLPREQDLLPENGHYWGESITQATFKLIIDDGRKTFTEEAKSCSYESLFLFPFQIQVLHCACKTEGCNSAPATLSALLMTILIPSISVAMLN